MPSDTLREIIGTFARSDATRYANQTQTWFRVHRKVTAQGDTTVIDDPIYIQTDATGQIDAQVLAGYYTVLVPLKDGDRYFNVTVPDAVGPHNVADLLDYIDPGDPVLTQVQQLVLKARAWAENPENVEVDAVNYPGDYSARNYALKAQAAALTADNHQPDFTALDATTEIMVGQIVAVTDGWNGQEELGKAFPAATYTADGSLVRDLPGSGLQWVSYRREFGSFSEMDADPRAVAAGVTLTIPSEGSTFDVAASSATDNDITTTAGRKLYLLDTPDERRLAELGGRSQLLRLLSRADRARQTIVVVGDSITEQAKSGIGNGIGYVTYLAEAFPNVNFINEGVGGDTTLDVIDRLSTVTSHGADGYILAIGVNDARYNDSRGATSQSAFVTNCTTIINAFKAATGYRWAAVLSIWPTFWPDQYAALGRKKTDDRIVQWSAALEANAALNWYIPYVNAHDEIVRVVDMDNLPDLFDDGVHPAYSGTAGKKMYADAILRDRINDAEFRSAYVPASGTVEAYKIRVLDNGASTCQIQNIKLAPYHKEFFAYSANASVAINGLVGSYSGAYTGYANKADDYPFEIIVTADQLPTALTTVPNGIGNGIKAWELYRTTNPEAMADPKHPDWKLVEHEYSTDGNAFNLFPRRRQHVYYRVDFESSTGTDGTGGTTGTYVKVAKIWGGVEPVRYAYENMLDLGATSERFDLFFSAAGGSASAYMANVANTYPLSVMLESPHELTTIDLASVGETGRDIKDWTIYRSYDPAALADTAHASWVSVATGTGDGTASV